MSVTVDFNGTEYTVPTVGETGWHTQVTALLQDIGANVGLADDVTAAQTAADDAQTDADTAQTAADDAQTDATTALASLAAIRTIALTIATNDGGTGYQDITIQLKDGNGTNVSAAVNLVLETWDPGNSIMSGFFTFGTGHAASSHSGGLSDTPSCYKTAWYTTSGAGALTTNIASYETDALYPIAANILLRVTAPNGVSAIGKLTFTG